MTAAKGRPSARDNKRLRQQLIECRAAFGALASGQIDSITANSEPLLLRKAQTALLDSERNLERQVAERTQELQDANRELEAFSFSVSHDLRAPLRHIDGFSRILLDDHSRELSAQGRGYLDLVRTAAERMGTLIDDLLQLSKMSRGELRRQRVDLSALARTVIASLQQLEPERKVELVLEEGLVAQADPGLVRILLDNLIGNAWKFTAKVATPRIEIGATSEGSGLGYYVRDNGAGFDMAYAHRLFGPFQRLHSERDFEGTGIGLSTVQKVIGRHGGRVWADGIVGGGATFSFTLSKEPELSSPIPAN
jgi:light-regulated signal transduction histidine kinase (bacteriophytochrome)